MCRWDRVEDCTFWRLRQLLQQPLEANAAKEVNVEAVFDEVYLEHVVVVTTAAATVNNSRSLAMMMLLLQLSNEIRTDWPCISSNNKKKTTTRKRMKRITLMWRPKKKILMPSWRLINVCCSKKDVCSI